MSALIHPETVRKLAKFPKKNLFAAAIQVYTYPQSLSRLRMESPRPILVQHHFGDNGGDVKRRKKIDAKLQHCEW
jgi:hypothetical protein